MSATPIVVHAASPTWLLVLQSISYLAGGGSFVVAARAWRRNRALVRGTAYADDEGHLVVDARNDGQIAGFVVECHLVKRRFLPWRRHNVVVPSRELPILEHAEPVLVPPFGAAHFSFDVQLTSTERRRRRVLLRSAAAADAVFKITKFDGVFPPPLWQPTLA